MSELDSCRNSLIDTQFSTPIMQTLLEVEALLMQVTEEHFYHESEYTKCWDSILDAMDSPEPCIKFMALKYLTHLNKIMIRRISLLQKCRMVSLLINFTVSDSRTQSKAVFCLGNIIKNCPELPDNLHRLGFSTFINVFLTHFPKNIEQAKEADANYFESKPTSNMYVIQGRIELIASLALFLNSSEALDGNFMSYVDNLFSWILTSRAPPLLHCAVIKAISGFTKTNRNRWRVDNFLSPAITYLSNNLDAYKTDSKKKQASLNHLLFCINNFWSIWYPLISDANVLYLKKEKKEMKGYAKLRADFIMRNSEQELTDDISRQLICSNTWLPYSAKPILKPAEYFVGYNAENITILHPAKENIKLERKEETLYTVKLDPMEVDFGQNPLVSFFLENLSATQETAFMIQCSDSNSLTISPSCGIIAPGDSVIIEATYQQVNYPQSATFEGYICCRSGNGWPIERIPVRAYNLPAIQISVKSIDFGHCIVGEEKTGILVIENLLPVQCVVVMAFRNKVGYSIPSTQEILEANDKKAIIITCKTVSEGPLDDDLYIVAFNQQILKVNLHCTGGNALKIFESKLDFGPTDIFYNPVKKAITVQNRSSHSLPIFFECSTNELKVNEGRTMIIKARELLSVPVEFTSAFTGLRREKITVTSPHSTSLTIECHAFSGPEILVPTHEIIYFPPVFEGQMVYVRIPFTNICSNNISFLIFAEKSVPIKLTTLGASITNTKPPFHAIETALYHSENGEFSGISVNLAPAMTALLEVGFKIQKSGGYKFELHVELVSPRQQKIVTYKMYAMVFDQNMVNSAVSSPIIRDFYQYPQKTINLSAFSEEPASDVSVDFKQSSKIRFKDSTKVIYGGNGYFKGSQPQTIELVNMTNEIQRYQLILSANFKTSIALEGELQAKASLKVPLFVDPIPFLAAEESTWTTIGSLFAFDSDSSNVGISAVQLHGVNQEVVWLQMRHGQDLVKFNHCDVTEKTKRSFVLRNKTPLEIDWSLDMSDSPNPFSLSGVKKSLKPYEYYAFDIEFQSNYPGNFSCISSLRYSTTQHEKETIISNRALSQITLKGSAGDPQIICNVDELSFGNVPFGDKISKNIQFGNNGETVARILISYSDSITIYEGELKSSSEWLNRAVPEKIDEFTLAPNTSKILCITYVPRKTGNYHGYISFTSSNYSHYIPVQASADKFQLSVDKVSLQEIQDSAEIPVRSQLGKVLDFGTVSTGAMIQKTIKLRNDGNMAINIVDISLGDQVNLKIGMKPLASKMTTFFDDNPESLERDWDELQLLKNTTSSFKDMLPIRLLPFQEHEVTLSLKSKNPLDVDVPIKIICESCHANPRIFVFWATGTVQPPLLISSKNVKFPISQVQMIHKQTLNITNNGTKSVDWKMVHDSTSYHRILGFESPNLPRDIECCIKCFPSEGNIKAGQKLVIDVEYFPQIPQYQFTSTFKLHSGDFAESLCIFSGIGANAKFVLSDFNPDFGVLRVGTTNTKSLVLQNVGMLKKAFFVEAFGPEFSVDPESGILEGGSSVSICVSYNPKSQGSHSGSVKISAFDNTLPPIILQFVGAGSYPDLVVHTKLVDFNIAMLKNENIRQIQVENQGRADAFLSFKCLHPDVRLERDSEHGTIIKAHSQRSINIIYTPQMVEKLNARAFIGSTDERGDNFMITLRGTVGIPKLSVIPADALSNLNFGVMKLNRSYEKTFKIFNDGTIFLNFELKVSEISLLQVVSAEEKKLGVQKEVKNVTCPIAIFPPKGTIGVGEEVEIRISFTPTMLVEYNYMINVCFDFYKIPGSITGIGGCVRLMNDSPLPFVDFGISRVGRIASKNIRFTNHGNLGFFYIVRPKPDNADWSYYDDEIKQLLNMESKPITTVSAILDQFADSKLNWREELASSGFIINGAEGYCDPESPLQFSIDYHPKEQISHKEFRIYHSDRFETFEASGQGAIPKIYLREAKENLIINQETSAEIDIGIHPVKTLYVHYFDLVNDGPFPVEFMVEPMSSMEFEVYPRRGYIAAGFAVQIQLYFEPTAENRFSTTMRIIWEGMSLKVRITGTGGVGNLDLAFLEEADILSKSLDFGMVPFHSSCEKRFNIVNRGLVGVYTNSRIENEDYSLTQIGDIFPVADTNRTKIATKGLGVYWNKEVGIYIPPGMGIEIGVKYVARSATISVGEVAIKSDAGDYMVLLKGKGGTISLSHKGDLSFGDISCNYTYSRKVTIVNGGSIPATLTSNWLVVGRSSEHSAPLVNLSESYSSIDPRSQWARLYFCEANKVPFSTQLGPKDYWKLIVFLVRRELVNLNIAKIIAEAKEKTTAPTKTKKYSGSEVFGRKTQNAPGASAFFKRRQMFYHLITSTSLGSQSATKVKPHIKVSPPVTLIPSYGEVTLTIDLHLTSEDTFLATLVVKADVPTTPTYEISLSATPKLVSIYCNDTRMLNFYRQPIGDTELITRTFTNIGHKEIPFKFVNQNHGLTIVPNKGIIKIGQVIDVTFAFKPMDENVQTQNVIFEPLNSQPIRFKMYGGGGYAKASLARYRRFDFGHCMIGKDTASFLPITNEGNAMLHLTKFEIQDTDTFFRGQDWPKGRISLFPGKTYQLPLVFNPHDENPAPSKLIIGTISESYEIELIGYGREAVLIVSKVALEFSECIIGNTYEQKLILKNIGDVNYPVNFDLEKPFPDVTFRPESITILPFSENSVSVFYKPTTETKTTVVLTISSPYSQHKVPLLLHSGYCLLDFNTKELDYGMFEKTTSPSTTLIIKNEGTVKTSFSVKDLSKPSIFQINPAKGLLTPGKSIEVKVTHTQHEVSQFLEKLAVKTDLADRVYYITAKGRCEETVLHPDEFGLLNMGVCPVLETTTKGLPFTNHGMFPLDYQIKFSYPLKVTPIQGSVSGKDTGTIQISWNPSGGYELRTQIIMETNIGTYQIVVRGKAMFPEIQLSTTYLDFGVCGRGYTYPQTIEIENKGKVPLKFIIPTCKDDSFFTSVSSATLLPKDVFQLHVFFSPSKLGKISSSILIECKGIHYKEIMVVGVGGDINLEIHPKAITLGRCPYDLLLPQFLEFKNDGDVTMFVDFSETEMNQRNCLLQVPQPFSIPPNRTVTSQIGFKAKSAGSFSCKVVFNTKEQTFTIPVSGNGIKINLNKRSKQILASEELSSLFYMDPLHKEICHDSLDLFIKNISKSLKLDFQIIELLSQIFVKKDSQIEPEMLSNFTSHRRALPSSFLRAGNNAVTTEEILKRFKSFSEKNDKIQEIKPEEQDLPLEIPLESTLANLEVEEGDSPEHTSLESPSSKQTILDTLLSIKESMTKDFVLAKDCARKFSEIKYDEIVPLKESEEDPLIQTIINYGSLVVEQIDMSPILLDVGPSTDVDISSLLQRPAAISHQKTHQNLKKTETRVYVTVFPSLDRRQRNARGDPFTQ